MEPEMNQTIAMVPNGPTVPELRDALLASFAEDGRIDWRSRKFERYDPTSVFRLNQNLEPAATGA
jgi:hypothetical protein